MSVSQSRVYFFKTTSGDEFIPIADGSHFTDEMNLAYTQGLVFLQFYDANKQPVTPATGTVTFRTGMFENQFQLDLASTTITAANVQIGDATYLPIQFNRPARFGKMTLSTITGAVFVRAFHWRAR